MDNNAIFATNLAKHVKAHQKMIVLPVSAVTSYQMAHVAKLQYLSTQLYLYQ